MFGVIHKITITQVSTTQYPDRTRIFEFDFIANGTGSLTWDHLTDTYHLILPRRIYFKDTSTNTTTTWDKEAIYGNPTKQPLLLRSDKITIEQGYSYFKPTQNGGFDRNQIVTEITQRFSGYITRIRNTTPFEIECKDNMFALMQTTVANREWTLDGNSATVEIMLKDMLAKSTFPDCKNFTIKVDNFKHNIGKVSWTNYTMAQVLAELKRLWHLQSFFRGNELRCGVIRYYPEDRVEHIFHFQKNIFGDNLDYQRADDVRIGIIAKSINKVELHTTNSSGKRKTKHEQLSVTVGDKDGDLITEFYWGYSLDELQKTAEKRLPFVKYEGFRGSFDTFGLPTVKHGDSVQLINDVLPERNGTYLVKMVEPLSGSKNGLKQRITIDIRIDGLTNGQLLEYQTNGA